MAELSIGDLWCLYNCDDPGFMEFVSLAAQFKLEAIKEARSRG